MQDATGDLQLSASCCMLAVLSTLLCWGSTLSKAVCGTQVLSHMLDSVVQWTCSSGKMTNMGLFINL